MVFFEDVEIFEHATGQHNMVFVLQKLPEEVDRGKGRIKIVRVLARNKDLPGNSINEKLSFLRTHIEENIDKKRYKDDLIKVFWSGAKQEEFPEDGGPWHLKYTAEEDNILTKISNNGEALSSFCNINSGVQSGADKVTQGNLENLSPESIERHNVTSGDGIFVLTRDEVESLNLTGSERKLVKRFVKNSDVDPYLIPEQKRSEQLYLIYSYDIDIDDYPNIRDHLKKYKPILKQKREYKKGRREWYELQWPRDQQIFESSKIVNPQRTPIETKASFAYTNEPLYASVDVYFTTLKEETRESLFYLLGILNSELIKFWLTYKGKRKGNQLELYRTPLSKIPIFEVDFDDPNEVHSYALIETKTKKIRMLMKQIQDKFTSLVSQKGFPKIITSNSIEVEKQDVMDKVHPQRLYSIRTHPSISIKDPENFKPNKFYLKEVGEIEDTLYGTKLGLKGKDNTEIYLEAPIDILEFLKTELRQRKSRSWSHIKENILVPKQIQTYKMKKEKAQTELDNLRSNILYEKKEINKLVLDLYGITDGTEINIIKNSTNRA